MDHDVQRPAAAQKGKTAGMSLYRVKEITGIKQALLIRGKGEGHDQCLPDTPSVHFRQGYAHGTIEVSPSGSVRGSPPMEVGMGIYEHRGQAPSTVFGLERGLHIGIGAVCRETPREQGDEG